MKTTTLLKPNSSNPRFYRKTPVRASAALLFCLCAARPGTVHAHESVAWRRTKMTLGTFSCNALHKT
jgi:hypothetical protein